MEPETFDVDALNFPELATETPGNDTQEVAPAEAIKVGETPAFTVIIAEPDKGVIAAEVLSVTDTKVYVVEAALGVTKILAPDV